MNHNRVRKHCDSVGARERMFVKPGAYNHDS